MTSDQRPANKPLDGIRVMDFAQVFAGPTCTRNSLTPSFRKRKDTPLPSREEGPDIGRRTLERRWFIADG